MLRWPSRRFWRIKSAFFVVFLPVFCASSIVSLWAGGMLAFGPPRRDPVHLRVMGWFATAPFQPSERFPTGEMLLNVIIALGANAVVWAWVASLVLATIAEALVRAIPRRGDAAT